MTPKVYLLKVNSPVDENTFKHLLKYVSDCKKERILNQSIKQNADNILLAEVLLRVVLKKVFGIEAEKQIFSYNENGKPYLANYDNVHFSISHSGEFVAVVVSESPVGVDIQIVKKYNKSVAKKYYSDDEIKQIEESVDKDSQYTKIWTTKEAVIKKSGAKIANGNLKCFTNNVNVNSKKIENYWLTVAE